MDEKILREMIEEQKQIIANAQKQLNKLYEMATQSGIAIDAPQAPNLNSIKSEIDKKRQELIRKAEQIRADAMRQAQSAMASAKGATEMANMPFGFAGMPAGLPALGAPDREKKDG